MPLSRTSCENGGFEGFVRVEGISANGSEMAAISDQTVKLPCATEKSENFPVSWQFSRKRTETPQYVCKSGNIQSDYGERFSLEAIGETKRDLVIRNIRSQDAGYYSCVEKHGLGSQYDVRLVVFKNSSDVTVISANIGERQNLTCSLPVQRALDWWYQNKPYSTVSKLCSNGEMTEKYAEKFAVAADDKYSLLISSTVANDSGLYICSAVEDVSQYRFLALNVSAFATSFGDSPTVTPTAEPTLIIGIFGAFLVFLIVLIIYNYIFIFRRRARCRSPASEAAEHAEFGGPMEQRKRKKDADPDKIAMPRPGTSMGVLRPISKQLPVDDSVPQKDLAPRGLHGHEDKLKSTRHYLVRQMKMNAAFLLDLEKEEILSSKATSEILSIRRTSGKHAAARRLLDIVQEKRKKYRLRLCVDPTALRSWIVH